MTRYSPSQDLSSKAVSVYSLKSGISYNYKWPDKYKRRRKIVEEEKIREKKKPSNQHKIMMEKW
jgi:hypothetical protein